jgi:hypothetical protein
LRLALPAENGISDDQRLEHFFALAGVHADDIVHGLGVSFAHGTPAKTTHAAGFSFTLPTFHYLLLVVLSIEQSEGLVK